MKFVPLLFALLLSALRPAHASLEFNARLSQACQSILRLDFAAGQALLDAEKRAHPSNKLVHLYENYIDFLRAFLSDEESYYKVFRSHYGDRYDILEDESPNTPWNRLCLAELKLQDALLKIQFRDYVPAAFALRSAYRLLEKNKQLWPGFALTNKGLGLAHVAVGSVPPEYRWLPELAGMSGSVSQGVAELRSAQAAATGLYAPYAEEVLFYLSTLQCSLGFPSADLRATALQVRPFVARSPLLRYAYLNLCIRSGDSKSALDQVMEQPGYNPIRFMHYKKGMLLLYQLDPQAEIHFRKFLEEYHGRNYIKSAWQKLGWTLLIKGDTAGYRRCMQIIVKAGTTFVDDDKQAETEARGNDLPNVRLLRARLLFDGGNYDRALAEFRNIIPSDIPLYRDKLEFTYRLARIYHATGQEEKAMTLFRQTLRNGESARWYFAANSALQLGTIYEEKGRADSAAYYYNRCLDLRHHEYQNSLDQKARAGLERVRAN